MTTQKMNWKNFVSGQLLCLNFTLGSGTKTQLEPTMQMLVLSIRANKFM